MVNLFTPSEDELILVAPDVPSNILMSTKLDHDGTQIAWHNELQKDVRTPEQKERDIFTYFIRDESYFYHYVADEGVIAQGLEQYTFHESKDYPRLFANIAKNANFVLPEYKYTPTEYLPDCFKLTGEEIAQRVKDTLLQLTDPKDPRALIAQCLSTSYCPEVPQTLWCPHCHARQRVSFENFALGKIIGFSAQRCKKYCEDWPPIVHFRCLHCKQELEVNLAAPNDYVSPHQAYQEQYNKRIYDFTTEQSTKVIEDSDEADSKALYVLKNTSLASLNVVSLSLCDDDGPKSDKRLFDSVTQSSIGQAAAILELCVIDELALNRQANLLGMSTTTYERLVKLLGRHVLKPLGEQIYRNVKQNYALYVNLNPVESVKADATQDKLELLQLATGPDAQDRSCWYYYVTYWGRPISRSLIFSYGIQKRAG